MIATTDHFFAPGSATYGGHGQMALVNKAWRESRFVPEGANTGLCDGRTFQDNVQNRAAQEIARSRFAYPSKEYPGLKAYVNRPDHTIGVRMGNGDLLFPSIVVLDAATTEVVMLAEVETGLSLRRSDVTDKWRAFAAAGRLFLFVPLADVDRARSLTKSLETSIAGLRAWAFNLGQQRVEVYEPPL
jgi:hypothetical protein